MRFDTPVYFQQITQGTYNASTGDYGSDTVVETEKYADVTETGLDSMRLIYGNLREDAKTVRVQGQYTEPFRWIRIGSKRYKVDRTRYLSNKTVFTVSEVQG